MIVMKHTTRRSKYKVKVAIPNSSISGTHPHREWCKETFGLSTAKQGVWKYGWIQKDPTFFFKHPKDATMFVLRWSNV
jgi:hypothetical protein